MATQRQRPARRHHRVSKFYLRHFANEQDQIRTVLLPGDRSFLQSITDASVENDYYTAIGKDGQATDVAEEAFNQIEAPASAAWEQIAAGVWPLPDPERGAVASWIALHLLRGSRVRASMNDVGTDLLNVQIAVGGRARLRETLKELGEPYDDESVTREWISLFENPFQVGVNANHHLEQLASMLPRVTLSLLERWWVLTTFERKGLATCDEPVFVVPNPENVALGMGTGIENANELHVPLTRRKSLGLVLRSSRAPEFAAIDDDVAQEGVAAVALYCNSCVVNSARAALFHHPDDSPFTRLELPQPRQRETRSAGDPWRFMAQADRQVLLDAGLTPPSESDQ